MSQYLSIRFAEKKDVRKILNIYEPYIKNTTTTFEYEVPTLAEFEARVAHISREYPYLVCEQKGEIIGYAYAARDRERAAYQWNAQLSVYLRQDCIGTGLGRKFYQALLDILQLQNVTLAYGCITLPNEKSQRLHESMGFSTVGCFRKTGFKLGKWLDVLWFEKKVCPHNVPPKAFVPIHQVADNDLQAVLTRINSTR
jgi:Sortase and related acyltransferases